MISNRIAFSRVFHFDDIGPKISQDGRSHGAGKEGGGV
jgi:hypothetical protein